MKNDFRDALYTLKEKLKDVETRTIILDECIEEMNDIIESREVKDIMKF